ncbi:MAG: hypothetical protein ACR2GD_05360 [Pyrinomonadaceae bacterium]
MRQHRSEEAKQQLLAARETFQTTLEKDNNQADNAHIKLIEEHLGKLN